MTRDEALAIITREFDQFLATSGQPKTFYHFAAWLEQSDDEREVTSR